MHLSKANASAALNNGIHNQPTTHNNHPYTPPPTNTPTHKLTLTPPNHGEGGGGGGALPLVQKNCFFTPKKERRSKIEAIAHILGANYEACKRPTFVMPMKNLRQVYSHKIGQTSL